MSISEYDAFGPWIYEITPEHPLPPLFAPYVPEGHSLMQFKIPRNIDRQAATPDMDLYDYVVIAYEDHIRILSRIDHTVESISVPYADIEAIRLLRHLLQGILTLYLKDGAIQLPFHTVSADIISHFVELIRKRYPAKPVISHPEATCPANMDTLFVNLLRELQEQEPEIRFQAYQATQSPKLASKNSPLQKAIFHLDTQEIPATLYLTTSRELIVLLRESASKKETGDAYSYHYTYLPLDGIQDAHTVENEQFKGILDCLLETPHHTISYGVDPQNQEVLSFLCSL